MQRTSKEEIIMTLKNTPKAQQKAKPSLYPQGYFKDKKCKKCGEIFKPNSPCELYCSDTCKDWSYQNSYFVRNYNITITQYWEIYDTQEGKCAICRGEGFTMNKCHKMKLVVDHCHSTGKVRGLLCHNCNRALGLLHDDVSVIETAVKYLNMSKQ